MRSTRRTQPYRKHQGRPAGGALRAMLNGAPGAGMSNPQDVKRALVKQQRRRRKRARGLRAVLSAKK